MAAASFEPSEEEVIDKKFGLVADSFQLKPRDDLLVYKTPPFEYWPKFQLPVPAASIDPSSEDVTERKPKPHGYWTVESERSIKHNQPNGTQLKCRSHCAPTEPRPL